MSPFMAVSFDIYIYSDIRYIILISVISSSVIDPLIIICYSVFFFLNFVLKAIFFVTQVSVNSVTQSCPTLWDTINVSTSGLPVHHQLPESTQIHVHWVGDAIQPSHPLLSLSPPALNLSQHQRSLSNKSALSISWPKYWSFSFNISPSIEHPGPISFRMNWLELFGVQGTLKSLLQHHSSKASFFGTQLSL